MENINIDFIPNRNLPDKQRLVDVETYLGTLTNRIKFCLANIYDAVNASESKDDKKQLENLIYTSLRDSVGEFTNSAKNAEIFNDYSGNTASGDYAHAEGYKTTASGKISHAEGGYARASGECSHAEGSSTASGNLSHAEGSGTAVNGWAHAEGTSDASGVASHAEGEGNIASGRASHAEGGYTRASGEYSHAEGTGTKASGDCSHAQNTGTVAQYDSNTAMGKYNEKGKDLALAVGNGTSDRARSNALELDWNGNLTLAGKINSEAVEISALTNLEIHDLIVLAKG